MKGSKQDRQISHSYCKKHYLEAKEEIRKYFVLKQGEKID